MIRKARTTAAGRATSIAPSLLALAALVAFFVPGAAERLRFDRAAVAAGELWRVLTGHLVHAGPEHLLWDTVATFALGVALSRRSPALFLGVVAAAAVAIPLGVLALVPSIRTYCGLSGIASALFAAYAVVLGLDAIRDRRPALAVAIGAVAAGFAAKLSLEAATGAAVFVDLAAAGLVPVPLAHLLGAAAGCAGGVVAGSVTKGA